MQAPRKPRESKGDANGTAKGGRKRKSDTAGNDAPTASTSRASTPVAGPSKSKKRKAA